MFKLLLVILMLSGCSQPNKAPDQAKNILDWNYDNVSAWVEKYPDAGGSNQSPINLVKAETKDMAKTLNINYKNVPIRELFNSGYDFQALIENGQTITYEGNEFSLLQFHFHADSEHTFDGAYRPLEMHMVHQHTNGELAVVGVTFKLGQDNPAFAKYLANAPKEFGQKTNFNALLPTNQLLPAVRSFYSYTGSLTAPPCTEGASWIVMSESLEVSQTQLDAFAVLMNGKKNNRPVQALNARQVFFSK